MKPPPVRELEILLSVARGNSLRQIASSFRMSQIAVRESLVKTRERYRAPNNESAIARALDRDDLPVPLVKRQISIEEDEHDLLGCIAAGYDDRQLMARFYVSRSTIDTRVARVLQKLRATNRCHAVYLGFGHGLIVLDAETPTARQGRMSELKAIEAIASSKDLEEAARKMGVEYNTAKSYLQRSRRRHHARTTQHLVALAIRGKELQYSRKPPASVRKLTQQEISALSLMAGGLHDPAIGTKLGISTRKVGPLINDAIAKLGAKSRAHAVLILFEQQVLR